MLFSVRNTAAALFLTLIATPTVANAAATASERAAAEALFDSAIVHMHAGEFSIACPELQDSQQIDPGVGTLLYLGQCYEEQGRMASAWATFREAAYLSRRTEGGSREAVATESADRLHKIISFLHVKVTRPYPAGMTITRLDRFSTTAENLAEVMWTRPIPIDPGEHVFEASALNKKPWSQTITVPAASSAESGHKIELVVPQLEDTAVRAVPPPPVAAPATQPESAQPSPAKESDSGLKTVGYIVGGTGIAVLIAGGVTTAMGLSLKSDMEERCPDNFCVSNTASEQNAFESDKDSLSTYGTMTTAFFIGGGVLTAVGVTLVMVGGDGPEEKVALELSPIASPSFQGLGARGTF